jgi:hypothetical protein
MDPLIFLKLTMCIEVPREFAAIGYQQIFRHRFFSGLISGERTSPGGKRTFSRLSFERSVCFGAHAD